MRISLAGITSVSATPEPNYEGVFVIAFTASGAAGTPIRVVPGRSITALQSIRCSKFEYSQPLDPTTITLGNFVLSVAGTSQPVPVTVTLRGDHTVRVVPQRPVNLLPNSRYIVQVSSDVQDTAGGHTTPLSESFMTSTATFLDLPGLPSATPAEGALSVDATAEIHLSFGRSVNPLTVNEDSLHLSQNGEPVAFSISLANYGNDVFLTPLAPFRDSGGVQLRVSGVEDLSGNVVPSFTSRFQVRVAPATGRCAIEACGYPKGSCQATCFLREVVSFYLSHGEEITMRLILTCLSMALFCGGGRAQPREALVAARQGLMDRL